MTDNTTDQATDREMRVERDTMGEVRVPVAALWGAQTQRAVENFPVSGMVLERSLVEALARIKGVAAAVNARLGVVDPEAAAAIEAAAAEVAAGDHDDQFPVDVFQTGSGTSSNMNANEVIAHLASRRLGRAVHPNDEVNASQSSNDVFPSAIHIAAARQVDVALLPALEYLRAALSAKAQELASVVKSGRTHLMDATPVTVGQELGGYAAQVDAAALAIRETLTVVGELPLGGTAVGTGLNCPPGFASSVIQQLAHELELPLTEAPDHFAVHGARDALVRLSGALRTLAVALVKVGNDIRWMASGPRTGLAEIRLPDLQPGSSIMPGKVNPVMVEAMTQVAAQVIGNDATIAFAGSQGNFELNVYLPVIAHDLLESIRLLANVTRLFADRCVAGIEADVDRCRAYAESSPSLGTSLNPYIGYEKAAEVVKESVRTGRSVREIVVEQGLLSDEEVDRALDVLGMAQGGVRR
ncbi:MAG TPA: class II fumarate hydratase [Acidimicrobiales bacterium]|nr:class II fumarate hydratase [Acidimicrobiales bacterium]